jgi:hypothetical protein
MICGTIMQQTKILHTHEQGHHIIHARSYCYKKDIPKFNNTHNGSMVLRYSMGMALEVIYMSSV